MITKKTGSSGPRVARQSGQFAAIGGASMAENEDRVPESVPLMLTSDRRFVYGVVLFVLGLIAKLWIGSLMGTLYERVFSGNMSGWGTLNLIISVLDVALVPVGLLLIGLAIMSREIRQILDERDRHRHDS